MAVRHSSAAALVSMCCLLATVVNDASHAGAPAEGALGNIMLADKPLPLLGGRLAVKMPAGAKIEARNPNIMAAPEAAEDETRIILDAAKERLVLMAYEEYTTTGKDLEKGVRADISLVWGKKADKLKLEKLAAAPLKGIAVVPPRPDGEEEANLVLAVYVRSEDSTVQYLAFYVNPEGTRDVAGATALARKIAGTISAGKRKLAIEAGARTFSGVADEDLVVTVPEGFAASTQEGPDFSVYRLRKLVALGQLPQSIGIYLGGHPHYHYRQAEEPTEKIKTDKRKLFGHETEWKSWSKGRQTTTEAIVSYPKSKNMYLHVFCSAASEEATSALRTVVETLRVEKRKK